MVILSLVTEKFLNTTTLWYYFVCVDIFCQIRVVLGVENGVWQEEGLVNFTCFMCLNNDLGLTFYSKFKRN